MNQITTQTTLSTVRATETAELTPAESRLLSVLSNALEQTPSGRWEMPDTAFVSDGDRQWLEARAGAIQRSFAHAHPDAIAAIVAGMFLRFPPSGQANDIEGRIAAYVTDLQQFPLWAIERAVARLKGPWAPAANVLCDAVREVLTPSREELVKVRRLLSADVYHVPSPDERARMKARFEELLAELRLYSDFDKSSARRSNFASPQNTQQQAQKWLAENAAVPVPQLSEEALTLVRQRMPAMDGAA